MRKVLIAVALAEFVSPAAAASGVWYEDNNWTVEANLDHQYCTATTKYNNGRILTISMSKGNVSLFLSQTSAKLGEDYKVQIGGDKGITGHFIGTGIGGGNIVFEGLYPTTVYQLAKHKRLYVEGIGSLEMTGSYRAITKMMECAKATRELL